jgi:hypothetical protein
MDVLKPARKRKSAFDVRPAVAVEKLADSLRLRAQKGKLEHALTPTQAKARSKFLKALRQSPGGLKGVRRNP